MDAEAATPKDLFGGHKHYEVPSFQRPYVWTADDQWEPLWRDLIRVAEVRAAGNLKSLNSEHFLGAVVLKQLPSTAVEPSKFSVIDGQQRLTTLQLVMDACHEAMTQLSVEDSAAFAESIENLVVNNAARFEGTSFRFKLWPSKTDRIAFEHAMDDKLPVDELESHRVIQAHRFFVERAVEWVGGAGATERLNRIAGLADGLVNGLSLVAITLGDADDDHVIFETLNDRGTPLLKADLIKNWLLQSAVTLGADADEWADKYWLDLDDEWWREEVRQGRAYRSRIDLFLQYWLTMRAEEEVFVDDVFKSFRVYFEQHLTNANSAESALAALRKDADTYRGLISGVAESHVGRFHGRVIETLELGAFMPMVLRLLAHGGAVPEAQMLRALSAMESWAVRRTMLRMTMQGLNQLVVSLLKHVSGSDDDAIGEMVESFLSSQTADARRWPDDGEVMGRLPSLGLYGSIRQPRIRLVLEAVEWSMRTDLSEAVALPQGLEIEHLMPRGWREHWGTGIPQDPELVQRRDLRINTIGNLTLVTKKLNGTLSHRPWTDAEAKIVAPKGEHAGKGKRTYRGIKFACPQQTHCSRPP